MSIRSFSAVPGTLGILAAVLVLMLTPLSPATADDSESSDATTILAFGDSLVHGYGLPEGETFPSQLEAALQEAGLDASVINAGNSGDTTESGRARLDWILQDNADAVIVVLGANDALRGVDPARTRDNLDRILQRLTNHGLEVLLAGMKAPRNLGSEYVGEFDPIYPELAEEYGVVFYPFFLEGVAGDSELNQGDGIHPNAEGVGVIVDGILPDVKTLIERAREDQPTG